MRIHLRMPLLPSLLAALSILLLLASGCSNEEEIQGGEGVITDTDVNGAWVLETTAGETFNMNLSQKGISVTGDGTIQGERLGISGQLQSDVLVVQLFSTPPLTLQAQVSGDRMGNGQIVNAGGSLVTTFEGERR